MPVDDFRKVPDNACPFYLGTCSQGVLAVPTYVLPFAMVGSLASGSEGLCLRSGHQKYHACNIFIQIHVFSFSCSNIGNFESSIPNSP